MEYNNSQIRRQDRLLSEEQAYSLLTKAEYGVLSIAGGAEGGYGIPLNFVWDRKDSIYFHCAPEGRKLRLLEQNNQVSFCIVGNTNIIPHKFTTNYESILVFGSMSLHLPEEERMHALELLLDKYSPHDKTIGLQYAVKSFHRTTIMRLDIKSVSGKSKSVSI